MLVTDYEASEDKVYKEPLLTDQDEPPPAPVMLVEPAPVAPVTLECSEPAYTEYPEPGQPGRTGGLVRDELSVWSRFQIPETNVMGFKYNKQMNYGLFL